MRRNPYDDEENSFDEMFRMIEQIMEEMVENMDQMAGPYGSVDIDVDYQVGTPGERERRASDTPVDVHEEENELVVVVDLPGVSQDRIAVRCDGQTLSITADGDRRVYDERIQLPARVDEEAATASYNNGVLEVTLPRRGTDDTGSTISID